MRLQQGLGFLLLGRQRGGGFASILLGLVGEQNRPAQLPGSGLGPDASLAIRSRIASSIPGVAGRGGVF